MLKKKNPHKISFVVFTILRFAVIAVLLRQIHIHNYESAFLCVLTLLLLYIPSWIQMKLHMEFPQPLEITLFCFIFAAEILGEVNCFYEKIPQWDTVLHTINGFLMAAIGFSMVMLLNGRKNVAFELSPFYLAVTAFCFSMTIGVMWEFFEFGMDTFFHTDMQKDTVVQNVYSVMLNYGASNRVVAVERIRDVTVNGRNWELGGYLDIGLVDTMKDLFVNFIGAVVFSLIGFLCCSGRKPWRIIMLAFVPQKNIKQNTL